MRYEADRSVLSGLYRAHGAGYQDGNRTGCLKGTRESVLDEIEKWAEDFGGPSVFWLEGRAGTGKSTIAQTIAERLFADGLLGASFFCSRDIEDRSDPSLIFSTLAFQLAQKHPRFRSQLIPLLRSRPDVFHATLGDQVQKLLVEPLRSANICTVIIIDAVDECEGERWLSHLVGGHSKVKLFITSRPKEYLGLLRAGVFVLHNLEPRPVDDDIRRFLKHELSRLAHRRGGIDGWPTDEQLDLLCRRAAGFFLYAVATVSFLGDGPHHPPAKLDLIMKSPESTTYEGKAWLNGYTNLDSLYMSILRESFGKNKAKGGDMVHSTLSAVVLAANPLSFSAIATLTGFNRSEVERLLKLIQSLLVLPSGFEHPVQPFHKSFPDFITDPDRCIDPQFHVPLDCHTELFLRCLELMGKSLKRNMCAVPTYALNSEVKNLPEMVYKSGIRGALEYACRSWYKHLIATKRRASEAVPALRRFLEQKFPFWLEVLSVLDAVGDAVYALSTTLKWLNEVRPNCQADCWVPSC